ncbi:hypothetical protein LCGC14_3082470 [marine sediment metagenome]|uniref:Uncharacterized protein n=1 Tax=marine sediment metagenome TaxID=412755 RepID=A0A0F8X1G2_9ZZZZ
MTRRERIEQKLEKRQEWAEGRDDKATSLLKQNEPFHGDHAFNTQPGHIPERARVIKRGEKAFEHAGMAAHHRGKADGLARQLKTSVFSDDVDAIEQLEERITERVAKLDRLKRYNTTCRKAAKLGEAHGDLSILDEGQRQTLKQIMTACSYQLRPGGGFPAYVSANLSGRNASDRKRIEAIKRQQERTQAAEDAGGLRVVVAGDWCSVTFAEKPERSTLDELKAAGFRWGAGSWSGYAAKLPVSLREGS